MVPKELRQICHLDGTLLNNPIGKYHCKTLLVAEERKMKKQVELVFVLMYLLSGFPTFGSWVETFDSGIGKFG